MLLMALGDDKNTKFTFSIPFLEKLIDKLPMQKLSANQVFPLVLIIIVNFVLLYIKAPNGAYYVDLLWLGSLATISFIRNKL